MHGICSGTCSPQALTHDSLQATGRHDLPKIDILSRPHVDLHDIGIMMNGGEFKGSGLADITKKKHRGSVIGEWYRAYQYDKIEDYIHNETDEFVGFYQWLMGERLPRWPLSGRVLKTVPYEPVGHHGTVRTWYLRLPSNGRLYR